MCVCLPILHLEAAWSNSSPIQFSDLLSFALLGMEKEVACGQIENIIMILSSQELQRFRQFAEPVNGIQERNCVRVKLGVKQYIEHWVIGHLLLAIFKAW